MWAVDNTCKHPVPFNQYCAADMDSPLPPWQTLSYTSMTHVFISMEESLSRPDFMIRYFVNNDTRAVSVLLLWSWGRHFHGRRFHRLIIESFVFARHFGSWKCPRNSSPR